MVDVLRKCLTQIHTDKKFLYKINTDIKFSIRVYLFYSSVSICVNS